MHRALDRRVFHEQAHDSKQEEQSSHQGLLWLLFIHQEKSLITAQQTCQKLLLQKPVLLEVVPAVDCTLQHVYARDVPHI